MNGDIKVAELILDALEKQEAKLLSWGIVDVSSPLAEISTLIDTILDEVPITAVSFATSGEVLDFLVSKGLIFEISQNMEPSYRSRMAETVRLMFHLRQLFPKHSGNHGWQDAPNLVADFRFIRTSRRYPDRNILKDNAVKEIVQNLKSSPLVACLKELVVLDLAQFQVTAAKKILHTFQTKMRSYATLISAGTGSGKTLSFYIPTLATIGEAIFTDRADSNWVKSLAIYPRNELLKDQFSEVYREARKLDLLLKESGSRKIRIATFFGPTPENYQFKKINGKYAWRRREADQAFVCEFLKCPTDNCKGELIWKDVDLDNRIERLVCTECDKEIGSDEIILTRERMKNECPDILFTTTEILNQRLGDNRYNHLFGVGKQESQSVQSLLLDEVHTYTGQTGAQTAYLIKRWRRMIGSRKGVSFVGLSATLKNGPQFMEQLTGVPEYFISEVSPSWDEMIEEGAEYALALRGDPVSKTALLSATIQATMLISRMLDPNNNSISEGFYGSKSFVFGDDLDVIQRLYHAMSDAEGRYSNGNINNDKIPLASLRSSSNNSLRFLNGQDWRNVEVLGHLLDISDRKQVARVMSMDPGVIDEAEIIVASAALEVGFNDPKVGAVVQHKAPRGTAQFLQRRGRAGRKRGMRPWTIVSLSDYARDRHAYQAFDHLFDPELPPSSLPVSSRYIKRMQIVYATMDYFSIYLRDHKGSIWTNLSIPYEQSWKIQKKRKEIIKTVAERILWDPDHREKLIEYLSSALQLSKNEIELLCWEQPRPLFLEVLPTLIRRLEKNWNTTKAENKENPINNSPLPEFVPQSFFSDLEQAEVTIDIRDKPSWSTDEWSMNLPQMLGEFTPFRVSKRYAMYRQSERYWLPAKLKDKQAYELELKDSFEFVQKGIWKFEESGTLINVLVCHPQKLTLDTPEINISDTSNASPVWKSQILCTKDGDRIKVSPKISWQKFIPEIVFHTHNLGAQIEVRRMSIGSEATLKYKDGRTSTASVRFAHNGHPSALGFSQQVDAIRFTITTPKGLKSCDENFSPEFKRAVRTHRFFYEMDTDHKLAKIENPFVRKWLAILAYSVVCIEAIQSKTSIDKAIFNLRNGSAETGMEDALKLLFQSKIVIEDLKENNNDDILSSSQDTLRSELEHWITRNEIMSKVWQICQTLSSEIEVSWGRWLEKNYTATIAAGIIDAIQNLCPDFDVSNLIVDLDAGVKEESDVYLNDDETFIWISEGSPGGVGQIEDFIVKYTDDPRKFFDLLSFGLTYNDLVSADKSLEKVISYLTTNLDKKLKDITDEMRTTSGNENISEAFLRLRKRLGELGIKPFHAFNVALNNRILKPGSSDESDNFFSYAIDYWNRAEANLGLELDARLIAYNLVNDSALENFFESFGVDQQTQTDRNWRFSTCYGLLWPRSSQIRTYGFNLYSRYSEMPEIDPIFVTEFMDEILNPIDVAVESWMADASKVLEKNGSVILSANDDDLEKLTAAMNVMATNPINIGYISAYCRLGQIRKSDGKYLVTLDLAEVML